MLISAFAISTYIQYNFNFNKVDYEGKRLLHPKASPIPHNPTETHFTTPSSGELNNETAMRPAQVQETHFTTPSNGKWNKNVVKETSSQHLLMVNASKTSDMKHTSQHFEMMKNAMKSSYMKLIGDTK